MALFPNRWTCRPRIMRFKNIERFKTGGSGNLLELGIPLPTTPDGRVYRYSPNPDAHPRHFLLGQRAEGFVVPSEPSGRMTHPPGTPGTICPYSGQLADDDEFTHPDDIEAAKELVAHAAHADMQEALHAMFSGLERRHSGNSFLKISAGPKPAPKPAPRFARRDLLRELVCDECGRDYGVYAISLFCPDCGAPNIHLHFAREADLVGVQVELAGKLGEEQGELAYRLMGNAHEDVLTAFEATLKTVYIHKAALGSKPEEIKRIGNAFQNVDRGRKRYAEFGFDPLGCLSPEALVVLTLNIQKRHVIGHNLGVADAAFAGHAADVRLGETVPLVGEDILQFAQIAQSVVSHIDAWLAGGAAPPTEMAPISKALAPPRKPAMPAVPKIGQLTDLAVRIGIWTCRESRSGFSELVSEEGLKAAFREATEDELGFAVTELEQDGYLRTMSLMSSRLPRMRTTPELYMAFDPHAIGTDPQADVLALIELVLARRNTIVAEELHGASEWPLRRFNPAFAHIVAHVDDRRTFSGSGEYPAGGFLLTDTEQVELHRLGSRLGR